MFVFNNRKDALDKMKTYRDSRVKAFETLQEATKFARYGLDKTNTTVAAAAVSSPCPTNLATNIEKSSYRGPKSQDLVLFRKLIEQDKFDQVVETIWKNPRYLIGSGDTPTILKVINNKSYKKKNKNKYFNFCF